MQSPKLISIVGGNAGTALDVSSEKVKLKYFLCDCLSEYMLQIIMIFLFYGQY